MGRKKKQFQIEFCDEQYVVRCCKCRKLAKVSYNRGPRVRGVVNVNQEEGDMQGEKPLGVASCSGGFESHSRHLFVNGYEYLIRKGWKK